MKRDSYDVVILLGGGVNLDGSLVEAAVTRIEKAAELYESRVVGAVIVCGLYGYKALEKPIVSEAQVYANYLKVLGVNEDDIYLEEKSQESLGNLLFAKMSILILHDWHRLIVIPTYEHSSERISYLLKKIMGAGYEWQLLRVGESNDPGNRAREAKSLELTKAINDKYSDGDHDAIYKGLLETHPAYGGTKWTIDDLRDDLRDELSERV